MYHQFNIQQFFVLPTQCIYVFCVDLTTNSDYFPIQLTGFITVTESVYCAVRTGSLYIIQVTFSHSNDERALPWNLQSSTDPPPLPCTDTHRHCHILFSPSPTPVVPSRSSNMKATGLSLGREISWFLQANSGIVQ